MRRWRPGARPAAQSCSPDSSLAPPDATEAVQAPTQITANSPRLTALIVACALFMQNLDSTVVATALPTMARAFGADPLHMNVALTSYMLSLAVFIPVSGWMADRYGSRTVFRAAIAVFTIGSVLCGRATNLPFLVAARIVQGGGWRAHGAGRAAAPAARGREDGPGCRDGVAHDAGAYRTRRRPAHRRLHRHLRALAAHLRPQRADRDPRHRARHALRGRSARARQAAARRARLGALQPCAWGAHDRAGDGGPGRAAGRVRRRAARGRDARRRRVRLARAAPSGAAARFRAAETPHLRRVRHGGGRCSASASGRSRSCCRSCCSSASATRRRRAVS